MDRITSLTQQLKLVTEQAGMSQTKIYQSAENPNLTDSKGESLFIEKSNIFGIVVDKKNKGIAGAVVTFRNIDSDLEYQLHTIADGRFVSDQAVVAGSYEISIQHPNKKFHTYSIPIDSEKLPAFKFREK